MVEFKVFGTHSGLDPLGLQAASVRLYQTLLPGISNVTLRARYYGLCAWLSDAYATRNHNADPENWKKTVRRSEALCALDRLRKTLEEAGIQFQFLKTVAIGISCACPVDDVSE
jgi:hypothetical protein